MALQEISRQSISINVVDEYRISWHNSTIAVHADKGINLFDYAYNLHTPDIKIELVGSCIYSPKCSPATSLFTKSYMKRCMKNIELTQMIVEPGLWPHNPQIMRDNASIIASEWSPKDLVGNNECVLAVLTNVGNIELFVLQRNRWVSALNISTLIEEKFNGTILPSLSGFLKDFKQLTEAVDAVESCAICWCPELLENRRALFVAAQKNCEILFWTVNSVKDSLNADLFSSFRTEIGEVVSMLWIPRAENVFLLVCSTMHGQLFGYECKIDGEIKLLKTACLWSSKDRMIVNFIQYAKIDEKIVLIYSKHRHLVIQMFDKDFNLLTQYIKNVNDYKISSINKASSCFYLNTINCKIYKINIAVEDSALNITLDLIETKDNYANYDMYGVCFSANDIIASALMCDRQIYHRKETLQLHIVLFCVDIESNKEITYLFNNPTKSLSNKWDYIEIVRYKTMKSKMLPIEDIQQLSKDGYTDIYKFKLCFILLTIYNTLKKHFAFRNIQPVNVNIDELKENILAINAKTVLNNLFNKHHSNIKLNSFEKESFVGCHRYLEYFCKKYQRPISDFVEEISLSIIETNYEYICQCCEDRIEVFSCKNDHINMFCPLSCTPIESDSYLICKMCGVTARIEFLETKPVCVFCDQYLSNYSLPC